VDGGILRHFIVIIFTFGLAGCANNNSAFVNQGQIFSAYAVGYDDTDQSVTASAKFTSGSNAGPALYLNRTSFVQFDAIALNASNNSQGQAQYGKKLTGLVSNEIWGTHYFLYQNNSGVTYTNPVTLPQLPVAQYPTGPQARSTTFTVTWVTPDALGSDILSLNVTNTNGAPVYSTSTPTINNSDTGGTLVIPVTQTTALNTATYALQVCRERASGTNQSAAEGGLITTKVCTAVQTLTFSS
jgi:hypothetical protein